MAKPRVLVLRAPGANCDEETRFAFDQAGALAERIHINRLREQANLLQRFQILVIPGGFTYGDDVAAGKILANQLAHFLGDALRRFRDADRLVLGICNGFQALLRAGLLVPPDDEGPLATLAHNNSGTFEDRWVHLTVTSDQCPFLTGLTTFEAPVAHAEGRFLCRESWILQGLSQTGQVALRYATPEGTPTATYPANPNGSQDNLAGLCDTTGRVLGIMPHPERHTLPTHHPQWTRRASGGRHPPEGDGLALFRNAVKYFL
jgi:phosphoribosylformylglycinamidine synthase I